MRVYLVDDTSFIRLICRYHLVKAGYELVGEAHDGEVALKEILSLQPDCVLVDLALPGKNGAEIMREVQEQYPNIKFVVLSSLDKEILSMQAPEVHYSSYVRKPFEAKELLDALQGVELSLEKKKHG